jgi:uncharacterized protein YxeA
MKGIFFIIIGVVISVLIPLGLFGVFDNDKDNPFKPN